MKHNINKMLDNYLELLKSGDQSGAIKIWYEIITSTDDEKEIQHLTKEIERLEDTID